MTLSHSPHDSDVSGDGQSEPLNLSVSDQGRKRRCSDGASSGGTIGSDALVKSFKKHLISRYSDCKFRLLFAV